MRFPIRLLPRAWILAPAFALVFVLCTDLRLARHVAAVSGFSLASVAADPRSTTGYADGKRWLIVPEHDNATYQWIRETQTLASSNSWRLRQIGYENAPYGRETHTASPYRWWLLLIGWVDHLLSGKSLALGIERAALSADPLLHVVLIISATAFVRIRWGRASAALAALGLAALYPLGATFLPGVANDFALAQLFIFWSVALVVAGVTSSGRPQRWFFWAGVAGGGGLWVCAQGQLPVLAGIFLGGLAAAWILRERGESELRSLPWRTWSLGGAASSLLAYLLEFYPGHMDADLHVNAPLYGLAWLGAGELLSRCESALRTRRLVFDVGGAAACIGASAALLSLPIALRQTGAWDIFNGDLYSARLTHQPNGVVATNVVTWLGRDGATGPLIATTATLLLLLPIVWSFARGPSDRARRRAITVALGPVFISLAVALSHLRAWTTFDLVLLPVIAAAIGASGPSDVAWRARWLWTALACVVFGLGLYQINPFSSAAGAGHEVLTRSEIEGLYERALAHWISDHAGPEGATLLVPPLRTSSFCFYGDLRGLGTQDRENEKGLAATFRIASSNQPDEVQSLVAQREITHVILPSWDTDLEDFVRLKLPKPSASFIQALHDTDGGAFNWLHPVPYKLPPVAGFEGQSVLLLETNDPVGPAIQQSRLVEYLIEMHQLDQAAYASGSLLRYPSDLGSSVALAQLAAAQGDKASFSRQFRSIISNLSRGGGQNMAWDRRVSLAVVLAIGGRADLSRAQTKRCIEEASPERLRFLTTESLFHLMILCKRCGFELADPQSRALAVKLLPDDLQRQL